MMHESSMIMMCESSNGARMIINKEWQNEMKVNVLGSPGISEFIIAKWRLQVAIGLGESDSSGGRFRHLFDCTFPVPRSTMDI